MISPGKSINKKDAKIQYTRIVSIHPKYLFTDRFSSEKLVQEWQFFFVTDVAHFLSFGGLELYTVAAHFKSRGS